MRAEVATLATFEGGFLNGLPSVTRAPASGPGAGSVLYAGMASDDPAFYEWLAGELRHDFSLQL